MAKINRRFIDKHWMVFLVRGGMAAAFGIFALFCGAGNIDGTVAIISMLLLFMGIVDAVGALYSSTKKHGWFNSVIDSLVDVVAAILLLFVTTGNLANCVLVLSIYTIISGAIDIFHGFLSTVDPTDCFIRVLAGICGCVIGIVILNAGNFEISTFIRFFGAYMMIVGTTSLIYGVHNRAQNMEDRAARSESRRKGNRKKPVSKKK